MKKINQWILLFFCGLTAFGILIHEGKIRIPSADAKVNPINTVTVKKGDTVYRIAQKYNTDVESIAKLNQLRNPSRIHIGQKLQLPESKSIKAHQSRVVESRQTEIAKKNIQTEAIPVSSLPAMSRGKYLGEFTLTAYTAGSESTGKSPGETGYGITSSGSQVIDNLTIAVDPKLIPLGSTVYIEGIGYRIAQDTGSAIKGNRIDIYIKDIQRARAFGLKKNVKVELVE